MNRIKVICDTNFLYTDSSEFLSNKELKDLIHDSKSIPNYDIEWILPSLVVEERQFQMSKSLKKNINWISRIERITNKTYNITESLIDKSLTKLIAKEIKRVGFKIIALAEKKVDWHDIIYRSINRIVPFEDNQKEKGFRDAMIAETIFQYFKSNKKNKYTIVILTGDKLMIEYLSSFDISRTKLAAKFISSISELRNYLNILKSKLDLKIMSEFQDIVANLFYVEDDKSSIATKENIIEKIEERFVEQLEKLPDHVDNKDLVNYNSMEPIFIKIDGEYQIWHINIKESFKMYLEENIYPRNYESNKWMRRVFSPSSIGTFSNPPSSPDYFDKFTYVGSGYNLFNVILSTKFDPKKRLLDYKINDIEFIQNEFNTIHTITNTR